MKRQIITALFTATLATTASAGDVAAGKARAAACAGCHGADGISQLIDAPNLAGETNIYIDTQLKAFSRGLRSHDIMSEVAAGLSDTEMREIADWYAAITLEITPVSE